MPPPRSPGPPPACPYHREQTLRGLLAAWWLVGAGVGHGTELVDAGLELGHGGKSTSGTRSRQLPVGSENKPD